MSIDELIADLKEVIDGDRRSEPATATVAIERARRYWQGRAWAPEDVYPSLSANNGALDYAALEERALAQMTPRDRAELLEMSKRKEEEFVAEKRLMEQRKMELEAQRKQEQDDEQLAAKVRAKLHRQARLDKDEQLKGEEVTMTRYALKELLCEAMNQAVLMYSARGSTGLTRDEADAIADEVLTK